MEKLFALFVTLVMLSPMARAQTFGQSFPIVDPSITAVFGTPANGTGAISLSNSPVFTAPSADRMTLTGASGVNLTNASAVFSMGGTGASAGLICKTGVGIGYTGCYDAGNVSTVGSYSIAIQQSILYLQGITSVQLRVNQAPIANFQAGGLYMQSGLIAPVSASGIKGTTTADSAQAGSIGEYAITTAAIPGTSLTSASAVNATTQALTAGDWDVYGICDYTPAATTSITQFKCGINTTSGTFGAQDTYRVASYAAMVTGASANNLDAPVQRINISAGATAYLVCQSAFSVSTMSCAGTIRARRVR
ncbi:hypothetical protein UFOVP138_45 [uncultured Caudovirales phage]|uniref:Uncharacterized protein n=1 Tax=uncultured Caudovirales phage TaxID=2100421 RepID=A0A6J5LC59_9CAUD|nr:hypothetical protein UFOVP138_45 [uncultured Caudovirales phage]